MNINVQDFVNKKLEAARERKINEQILERAKQADKKTLKDLEDAYVNGQHVPCGYFSEGARFIAARAQEFNLWKNRRWQKKGVSKKISQIVTAAPKLDAVVTRDSAGVFRLCGEELSKDRIAEWKAGKAKVPVDAHGNPLDKKAAADWRADPKKYVMQHGPVREIKLDGGYVEKTLSQYVKVDVGLASGGKTACLINQKDGSVMTEGGYGFDGSKDENEAVSLGVRAMLMEHMRRNNLTVWPTLNERIRSFYSPETDPDRLRSIITDTATASLAEVIDEPPKSILAAYDLAKLTNNWEEYNKKDPDRKCMTWCAVYRGHDIRTDSVKKIIGEHGATYLRDSPDLEAHLRYTNEKDENGKLKKEHVIGVTYTCMLTNKHLMTYDRLRRRIDGGDAVVFQVNNAVEKPPQHLLDAYRRAKDANNWEEFDKKYPERRDWCAVYSGDNAVQHIVNDVIREHPSKNLKAAGEDYHLSTDEDGNVKSVVVKDSAVAGSRLIKESLAAQALGITDFSLDNPDHVEKLRKLLVPPEQYSGEGLPAWEGASEMSKCEWMVAVLQTKSKGELNDVFSKDNDSRQPAVLLDNFTKLFSEEIAKFLASPERVRDELENFKKAEKGELVKDWDRKKSIANAIMHKSKSGKVLLRHDVLVDILPTSLTYGYKNENECSHRQGGWRAAHAVVHEARSNSPAVYQHDAHFLVGFRSQVRQEECTYSHVYHNPSKGVAINVWTRPTDNRMSRVTGDSRGLEETTGGVPLLRVENFLGKYAPSVWFHDVYESFRKDTRLLESQNVSAGLLQHLMNNEITLHGMFGAKKALADPHLSGTYNQKSLSERALNRFGQAMLGSRFGP